MRAVLIATAASALLGAAAGAQSPAVDPEAGDPVAARPADPVVDRFAAMDRDGNGRVDAAEWDLAIAGRLAARSTGPSTSAREGLRTPTADAPLPLPTARRAALMRELFGRIDSDGDGGLSLVEVRAFGRALGAERP